MTPQQLEELFEDAQNTLAAGRAFGLIDANTYNFGLHIVLRMKQAGVPRLILAPKVLHDRSVSINGVLYAAPPTVHLHEAIDILQQLHFAGGIMNGLDVDAVKDDAAHTEEHFTLDPFLSAGVAWNEDTPIIFAINCNSMGKASAKLTDLIERIEAMPDMIDNYLTATPAAA